MTPGAPEAAFSVRRDDLEVTTAPDRIDVGVVHGFLTASYWATGIPRELVERALAHSLNFGLYRAGAQIGLARFVTDYATFAWLADVFVLEPHRRQGLATWLVGTALTHPVLTGLRRLLLVTRDQQALYGRLGFAPLAHPERFMEVNRLNLYQRAGG
ncbi:MAG: GNAT family N-acetyltransferase [Burkholderiales bacterium]